MHEVLIERNLAIKKGKSTKWCILQGCPDQAIQEEVVDANDDSDYDDIVDSDYWLKSASYTNPKITWGTLLQNKTWKRHCVTW